MLLAVAALLAAGCSTSSTGTSGSGDTIGAARSSVPPGEGCDMADRGPASSGATDVPEAPEPLLVEQRMESSTGPFVRRISPTGSYWEYSSTSTTFEGGQMVSRDVEPEWRKQPQQLSDDQVERLQAVLDEHFFDLAPEYRPPGEVADGFVVTWRACADGGGGGGDGTMHTVTLHSVDPAEIAGLTEVRDAFEYELGVAAAGGE